MCIRDRDGEVVEDIIYSPDGKSISMIKGKGDLWIADADGKNQRKLISSWNAPRYDWSPNSRWIAYSVYDNNFNRDIWIVPVDGSKPAFNLSRHPDSDGGVKWSPDGKLLAFTGRRFDTETDIYYVSIMVLFGLNFVNYLVITKLLYQDCGMFNVKKNNLLSN